MGKAKVCSLCVKRSIYIPTWIDITSTAVWKEIKTSRSHSIGFNSDSKLFKSLASRYSKSKTPPMYQAIHSPLNRLSCISMLSDSLMSSAAIPAGEQKKTRPTPAVVA